ncbi:unnamed protein product [Ilex paraguariensis]|uniref:Uncharacterized protein n=1 Tax=Ilex paraguariensis TaxID=185542 RepID=A0ABC8V0M4_9AQUA
MPLPPYVTYIFKCSTQIGVHERTKKSQQQPLTLKMSSPPALKKPKIERDEESNGDELEEALVALIEYRTKEVENLRCLLNYYKSEVGALLSFRLFLGKKSVLFHNFELDQAERRLEDTQSKLAQHQGRDNVTSSKGSVGNGMKEVKVEQTSTTPFQITEGPSPGHSQSRTQLLQGHMKSSKNSLKEGVQDVKLEQRSSRTTQNTEDFSRNHPQSSPQLVIPAVNPRLSQPRKMTKFGHKANNGSGSRPSTSFPTPVIKLGGDKFQRIFSEEEVVEIQSERAKWKFEQKDHRQLIPFICSCSSPSTICCQTSCLISSQHKRKLRSLALCPTNSQLFVTSALDGVINLWQVQARGSSARLISTSDCLSPHRRWPEDIAWHPQGNNLFSVYGADDGDYQISTLNLDKAKEAL